MLASLSDGNDIRSRHTINSLLVPYQATAVTMNCSRLSSPDTIGAPQSGRLLPDELLAEVFDDVDDSSLYQLAMTCRRLHFWALFLLFERHSQSDLDVRGVILFRQRMHLLPALRISLFVTSLPRISCSFNASEDTLFREIHRLRGFISRLVYVGRVDLNLPTMRQWMKSHPYDPPRAYAYIDAEKWKCAFLHLLQTALDRSCSSLTVSRGDNLTGERTPSMRRWTSMLLDDLEYGARREPESVIDSQQPSRTSLHKQIRLTSNQVRQKVLSAVKRFFKAVGRKRRIRLDVIDGYPIDANGLSPKSTLQHDTQRSGLPGRSCEAGACYSQGLALTTFRIHSTMLFYPLFYHWTVKVLNSAPITCLSLKHLRLSSTDWAHILPSLTLPGLSELTVGVFNIAFIDFSKFLARHPYVTTLDIASLSPTEVPRLSDNLVPRLKKLTANPEYFICLLGPQDAAPELTLASITPYCFSTEYTLISDALACVARRSKVRTLALEIPSYDGAEGWFRASVHGSFGGDEICSLTSIKNLKIGTRGGLSFTSASLHVIPRWLTLFPALEHIEFLRHCVYVEEDDDQVTFVRAISRACPGIHTVSIDGDKRIIADWLHSE